MRPASSSGAPKQPTTTPERGFPSSRELGLRSAATVLNPLTCRAAIRGEPSEAEGRDLARRNPFIYSVRGIETLDEWVDHVLADNETSAIEGHIGTFLEQVARIVSDGIKPGNGVDLQLVDETGTAHLFAIRRRTRRTPVHVDLTSSPFKRAARPLRANRQRVTLNVAILQGQAKTRPDGSDQAVTVLSSDDFWHRVSGIPDFGRRLLRASTLLG